MYNKKFAIKKQEEIIPGHWLMHLFSPEIAGAAVPGQFLHVRCGRSHDPLLRRPISIHCADSEKGEICLLYRVVGRGTELLSRMRDGELLDVLGPLGRGFTLPEEGESVAVIGGGMGFAPLFFLLDQIKKIQGCKVGNVRVFIGAATEAALLSAEKINSLGFGLYVATDDGSRGYRGNVVDLALKEMKCEHPDRVYACGPAPMLKGLAEALAPLEEVIAEASVEELMGCGVGACLSCVCRVEDESGAARYAHVCRDGPVFRLRSLCWQ